MLSRRLLASVNRSMQLCVVFSRKIHLSSVNRNEETTNKEERAPKTPSKIRVYTKTGDKGYSSLFTGERRPKNDQIFEALGNTDELNSSLGLAIEYCVDLREKNKNLERVCLDLEAKLASIQSTLLDIGSYIATPKNKAGEKQLIRLSDFNSELTKNLEKWIDEMDTELPSLRNFILPSGGKFSSCLHLSRSICRYETFY
jgi:cob(I)alamin adenosyltransferase